MDNQYNYYNPDGNYYSGGQPGPRPEQNPPKKEKKGQRCAGLPPFFIGEIWGAWGEGRRSGELTAGAGLRTMGNHAPGRAGPRREGEERRRTGRSSQK